MKTRNGALFSLIDTNSHLKQGMESIACLHEILKAFFAMIKVFESDRSSLKDVYLTISTSLGTLMELIMKYKTDESKHSIDRSQEKQICVVLYNRLHSFLTAESYSYLLPSSSF